MIALSRLLPSLLLLWLAVVASVVVALTITHNCQHGVPRNRDVTTLSMKMRRQRNDEGVQPGSMYSRRCLLGRAASDSTTVLGGLLTIGALVDKQPAHAVERAVGSAELECRQRGDCLEKGEWDGAVGWNWGAKDRCDATDPKCGPDGILREAPAQALPVPSNDGLKMTHQVELSINIGKDESGTLRMGLYGDACPKSVAQLVEFFSPTGLATSSKLMFEQGYGITSAPVSMQKGGTLNLISPGQRLDFGVPSQAAAFARSKGMARAGSDFVPQPRPKEQLLNEAFARKHTSAGLVSIPEGGLGFGGSSFSSEDEAFADAFQITASAVPSMDSEGRRVVGQLMDNQSMSFLARLASLPTKKGFKGVIPGLDSGPPLVKTSIAQVEVKPL